MVGPTGSPSTGTTLSLSCDIRRKPYGGGSLGDLFTRLHYVAPSADTMTLLTPGARMTFCDRHTVHAMFNGTSPCGTARIVVVCWR